MENPLPCAGCSARTKQVWISRQVTISRVVFVLQRKSRHLGMLRNVMVKLERLKFYVFYVWYWFRPPPKWSLSVFALHLAWNINLYTISAYFLQDIDGSIEGNNFINVPSHFSEPSQCRLYIKWMCFLRSVSILIALKAEGIYFTGGKMKETAIEIQYFWTSQSLQLFISFLDKVLSEGPVLMETLGNKKKKKTKSTKESTVKFPN